MPAFKVPLSCNEKDAEGAELELNDSKQPGVIAARSNVKTRILELTLCLFIMLYRVAAYHQPFGNAYRLHSLSISTFHRPNELS